MKLFWFYTSRTIVALVTVLGVYALITPALFIGALSVGTPPAFIALAPLALIVFMLIVSLVATHWTPAPFKATILATHWLFSPRRASALLPPVYVSGFAAVVFVIAGVFSGKLWELVGTLIALGVNTFLAAAVLWVVAGTWYSPRERKDAVPPHLSDFLHRLTDACKPFFAPAAEYTYKRDVPLPSGKTKSESYVDEEERYADTQAAIISLQELAPNKYQIEFDNSTGKTDDDFVKFFKGAATKLKVYGFDEDEEPKMGTVRLTVQTGEQVNQITAPHGMLMWR